MEGVECFACVFSQTPSPVRVLPLIQEGEFFSLLFNILLKLLLLDKRRWPSGRRSLKLLLVFSVKLPPPFGYSLLSKRESFSLCIQYVTKAPPLG